MRSSLLVISFALAATGCSSNRPPTSWSVAVAATAAPGVDTAADDIVKYLVQMGLHADKTSVAPPRCASGRGQVVFVAETLPGAPSAQTHKVVETRCGDGIRVELSGGGLFGQEYAAYAWLRRLGVRFFHPEAEYVPRTPHWPDDLGRFERTHTPPYRYRSTSLHLTHPLELGDPVSLGKSELFPEVRRHLDWTIKNFASKPTTTWPGDEGLAYAQGRGFSFGTGINLHEVQQGGRPIVDPDDPRPVDEQIAAAIDARMGSDPEHYPTSFGFSFNPSEFTEIDDQQAVSEMTFIANYMAEKYPMTSIQTINHGTHGKPTAHYGVRFYDLPKFAPANLGVSVHPLMFYDLERPAPMYGNTDFHFLYDFMADQYQTRELTYFPESAWWLTFDIAVPLYLPITLEARQRDFAALSYMLDGKLNGHHTFGSGHEWGYWQNEYCPLLMAYDSSYRLDACLDDITLPFGDHAAEVKSVLLQVIQIEERDLIYGDALAYVVGTDPETEIADSVGVHFHPLPPSPSAIDVYTLDDVTRWNVRIAPQLSRMASELLALADRLSAIEPTIDPIDAVWLREIRDGIEITGRRADHARKVYGALIGRREAALRFNPALAMAAQTELAAAKEATVAALAVITRREADYRYHPIERSIGGGPSGNEDHNWTIYPYRYLNRTHNAYYWTRIDELATAAFASTAAFTVVDAIVSEGTLLEVDVAADLTSVAIAFGDGATASATGAVSHGYVAPGRYALTCAAMANGATVMLAGEVASVMGTRRVAKSPKVIMPMGATLIEGVLPDLVLGDLPGAELAVGFSASPSEHVALGAWQALARDGADPTQTAPATMIVPIVNRGTGATLTSVVVENGKVIEEGSEVHIRGELLTSSIVDAVVAIGGGFDEEGARNIIAQTLGYTPSTLPDRLTFDVSFAAS